MPASSASRRLGLLALALALAACTPAAPPSAGLPSAQAARPTAVASSPAPTPSPTPPATAAASPSAPAPTASAPAEPVRVGAFDVALVDEASGLVAGRRDPAVLWILDDGPDEVALLAVDRTGTTLGVVRLVVGGAPVQGRDTEGLAAGPCGPVDPSPCLYVGDIGDNAAVRDAVQVHRIPEPAPGDGAVEVTTATFTHPRGPADAEGLVVTAAGVPVLFTKEEGRTRLLAPAVFADGPLTEIATLPLPEPALPFLTGAVGLTVTAADTSADGATLLLRTYDSVLELTAPAGAAAAPDLAAVGGWAVRELPSPFEPQGEAIALLSDGRGYATVSERSGDLWVAERPT